MTTIATKEQKKDRLLTTKQATEEWGITKWTIYRLVEEGKLKPVLGLSRRDFYFLASDFDALVSRRL